MISRTRARKSRMSQCLWATLNSKAGGIVGQLHGVKQLRTSNNQGLRSSLQMSCPLRASLLAGLNFTHSAFARRCAGHNLAKASGDRRSISARRFHRAGHCGSIRIIRSRWLRFFRIMLKPLILQDAGHTWHTGGRRGLGRTIARQAMCRPPSIIRGTPFICYIAFDKLGTFKLLGAWRDAAMAFLCGASLDGRAKTWEAKRDHGQRVCQRPRSSV